MEHIEQLDESVKHTLIHELLLAMGSRETFDAISPFMGGYSEEEKLEFYCGLNDGPLFEIVSHFLNTKVHPKESKKTIKFCFDCGQDLRGVKTQPELPEANTKEMMYVFK